MNTKHIGATCGGTCGFVYKYTCTHTHARLDQSYAIEGVLRQRAPGGMTATACNISASISSLEIQVHMHLHCVMCSHDIGHAQKRSSSAHHVTLALRFDWCMQQPRSNPVRCKLVKRLKHSNNYVHVYEKYSYYPDNRLLLEQKFRLIQNLGTKLIAINTAPHSHAFAAFR